MSQVDKSRLRELSLGDGHFARQLVELLIEDGGQQLQLMSQACRDGRREELGRIAHRLRGAALSIGAESLAELCNHMEESVRDGEKTVEAIRIEELAMEFRNTEEVLRKALAELNA